MPRVLLIEDDRSLGKTLEERLIKEGLEVRWVETLASARAAAADGAWDLAIVDVMLPDGSGFDLAPEIRQRSRTPIMFMTALNSAESRLTGFELGADEYLPKPFHLKEFMLRVRHVLTTQPPLRALSVGEATIDWDAMAVSVEVGYLKPHRAMFEHALTGLGVNAAEAVMVGNSLAEDVAGAQALGIRAVWRVSPPDAENIVPELSIFDVRALLDLAILQGPANGR